MSQIAEVLIAYRYIAAVAAPLAAIFILLVERRVVKIYALSIQYAMAAWLMTASLPLESAAAKLVAGLISSMIFYWGAARSSREQALEGASAGFPRGRVFRVIAVLLVVTGVLGVSFDTWIPVEALDPFVQQAAMLLLVLGILGIGLFINPLQVGISLVTIISGFEIVYSAVEPSLAIVALLALVHLGIALVISYFEIFPPAVDEGMIAQ